MQAADRTQKPDSITTGVTTQLFNVEEEIRHSILHHELMRNRCWSVSSKRIEIESDTEITIINILENPWPTRLFQWMLGYQRYKTKTETWRRPNPERVCENLKRIRANTIKPTLEINPMDRSDYIFDDQMEGRDEGFFILADMSRYPYEIAMDENRRQQSLLFLYKRRGFATQIINDYFAGKSYCHVYRPESKLSWAFAGEDGI